MSNDYVYGAMGRTATVGAEAIEYPEVEARLISMVRDQVDRDIANAGRVPMTEHTVEKRGPIEYDVLDEDTGEMIHIGPLYQFAVERFYSGQPSL